MCFLLWGSLSLWVTLDLRKSYLDRCSSFRAHCRPVSQCWRAPAEGVDSPTLPHPRARIRTFHNLMINTAERKETVASLESFHNSSSSIPQQLSSCCTRQSCIHNTRPFLLDLFWEISNRSLTKRVRDVGAVPPKVNRCSRSRSDWCNMHLVSQQHCCGSISTAACRAPQGQSFRLSHLGHFILKRPHLPSHSSTGFDLGVSY